MPRIITPHPQPITLPPQPKNNRDETDGQKAKQAITPVDAESGEHLRRKKREGRTEARTEEVVAGGDGSEIGRVRIAQIIEDRGELLYVSNDCFGRT